MSAAKNKRTLVDWWFATFGDRCHYCGRAMRRPPRGTASGWIPDLATIDHIIPKIRGGNERRRNKQVICKACNSLKGAMTHYEFLHFVSSLWGRPA